MAGMLIILDLFYIMHHYMFIFVQQVYSTLYTASVFIQQFNMLKTYFSSLKFKVTIWGDLASGVSESFKADLEKPVIGILTSAKLSTFRGMFSVVNILLLVQRDYKA